MATREKLRKLLALKPIVNGSSSIYIGKADEAVRAERDEEIYKRFNGENYLALAHTFGVSEKTVREAINRQNTIQESRQMTLILDD